MPEDQFPVHSPRLGRKKRRSEIAESNGQCADVSGSPEPTSSDYPHPQAVLDSEELVWDEDAQPSDNYRALGQRLAATGVLYRRPGHANGLLLVADSSDTEPVVIDNARLLGAIVVDRLPVRVVKAGNSKGTCIPSSHLHTMLACEVFLQEFLPVDDVVPVAHYRPDFTPLEPGYNDGGPGQRFLYVGPTSR